MQKLAILTLLVVLVLVIAAVWFVRSTEVPSGAEHAAAYEAALERTAGVTPPPPGSAAEAAAIERLRGFFRDLTPETVRAMSGQVYAADAWFNDTLKTIRGGEAIEAYFLKTAESAEAVEVEFRDVARSGDEFYVRWRMTMRVGALRGGEPLVSWGMTHFRFDEAGRVVLHQDYWDAAGGLYEHIPVVGGVLRAIRGHL